MDVDFVIKNYRRFSEQNPARFSIRDGLTAFVGVNNAGKSSLLRFFYDFRRLFSEISNANTLVNSLQRRMSFGYESNVRDLAELYSVSSNGDLEIECVFHHDRGAGINAPEKVFLTALRNTNEYTARLCMPDGSTIPDSSQGYSADGNVLRWGARDLADLSSVSEFFADLSNNVFIGPFRNAINVSHEEAYFDINVGRQFIADWRRMKSGSAKKNNGLAISVTASIKEIFGLKSLEINASDDGATLQFIINDQPFTSAEIGSGMAQFLLVLANAAFRRPMYIFIDEPELSLHPSLQIKFLNALASLARRGVFFATHNIGLARAAEQIYSVYTTSLWESRICRFDVTPRLSELLGELSYGGYRDLGYRKILLVEGATELGAINALLRLFGKGNQVVLLPMNGANLINDSDDTARQLEEIRRIAREPDSVSALIDSERTAAGAPLEAKREGFRRRCEESGVDCHVLERRSFENYLTEPAIKRALGDEYSALGPYEGLREATPRWSKHHNWKIASEMKRDDLAHTDLGEFLERL